MENARVASLASRLTQSNDCFMSPTTIITLALALRTACHILAEILRML
jgi:hypothetical protein